MKYYRLIQERRGIFPHVVKLNSEKISWENKVSQYIQVLPYKSKIGFYAPPFLENSVFMISEEMYDLFEKYQMGSRAKLIALDDPQGNILFYYIYQPPIISCLSKETTFHPGGSLKNMVLDRNKIGANKIFQPAWILENFLIVDFEILELLLAQAIYPFCFEEIQMFQDEERSML